MSDVNICRAAGLSCPHPSRMSVTDASARATSAGLPRLRHPLAKPPHKTSRDTRSGCRTAYAIDTGAPLRNAQQRETVKSAFVNHGFEVVDERLEREIRDIPIGETDAALVIPHELALGRQPAE